MSTFNFGTILGLTGGKYLIKAFLTLKSRSAYLKYQMCQFWDQFLSMHKNNY